jgi:biopolymer transport protein ExbB
MRSKWAVVAMAVLFGGIMAWSSRAMAQAAAPQPAAPAAATAPAAPAAAPVMELSKEGAAAEAKAKDAHASMDLWSIVTRAGWFGEMIWAMLFAGSLAAVALIVDSYVTIRNHKVAPPAVVAGVREAIADGDVTKAIQVCEATPTPLSTILIAGLQNVQEGFEVVQDAVSVAADTEGEKLLSRVTYLSVISNTTPMLGLIGTVQGMIYAFFTLATQQAGAAQQSMLALNISHGLWATAVGLATSVPAAIYYFYFKIRATKILLGMEALTLDVIKDLRNVEVVEA